jgi:hypothetical protein
MKSRSIQRREAAQRGEKAPQFPGTTPDRCPHCGTVLSYGGDGMRPHPVADCRDYLVAERDRLSECLKQIAACTRVRVMDYAEIEKLARATLEKGQMT